MGSRHSAPPVSNASDRGDDDTAEEEEEDEGDEEEEAAEEGAHFDARIDDAERKARATAHETWKRKVGRHFVAQHGDV